MAEFWSTWLLPFLIILGKILLIAVPMLLAMAYLTLAERKVIGAMQMRRGPNVVGPFGLLQPLADGAKLLLKETVFPTGPDRAVFVAAGGQRLVTHTGRAHILIKQCRRKRRGNNQCQGRNARCSARCG